jgi:hypothetical protein
MAPLLRAHRISLKRFATARRTAAWSQTKSRCFSVELRTLLLQKLPLLLLLQTIFLLPLPPFVRFSL